MNFTAFPTTLPVLLAVLVALAVSTYGAPPPAFADDHIRVYEEPVWSGNLTTSIVYNNIRGCHGSGNMACSSILSPYNFTYNGTTYAIVALHYSVGSHTLALQLDKVIPEMPDPVLVVGGVPLDFVYEEDTTHSAMYWHGVSLNWPRGAVMEISIVPSRDYLIGDDFGVELSYGGRDFTVEGLKLELPAEDASDTFRVRLTEDPGTTTITVNLLTMVQSAPYGAPGHNWNYAAANIAPKTITFTTGNWNSFQDVTVAGVPDGDYSPEQLIIVVVPKPSVGLGYMTGVHVTVADPCTACSTGGEHGAIPIPSGLAIPESAQLPVITLAGSTVMTVQLNSVWTDPGYTATDADGNDITASVTVSGTVDTSQAATYLLYYQVADAYGTPATPQTRTVNVIAPEPQYRAPEPEQEPQPEPQQEAEQEPTQEPEQEPQQQEDPQEQQKPTQEPEQEPQQQEDPQEQQKPTQEPEQEPESSLPAIVRQYDTDGSGVIEQDEWLVAVDDYTVQKLTTPEIQTIAAHRG